MIKFLPTSQIICRSYENGSYQIQAKRGSKACTPDSCSIIAENVNIGRRYSRWYTYWGHWRCFKDSADSHKFSQVLWFMWLVISRVNTNFNLCFLLPHLILHFWLCFFILQQCCQVYTSRQSWYKPLCCSRTTICQIRRMPPNGDRRPVNCFFKWIEGRETCIITLFDRPIYWLNIRLTTVFMF